MVNAKATLAFAISVLEVDIERIIPPSSPRCDVAIDRLKVIQYIFYFITKFHQSDSFKSCSLIANRV